MRSDRTLAELKALREAAATPEVQREGPAHDAWNAKTIMVMRQALGDKSTTLDRFTNLSYFIGVWNGAPGEVERDRQYFASQVTRAAALIDAAIYEVELMADGQSAGTEPVPGISAGAETVFLVHGHNGAAKHEVARFVGRITGKSPVILDEQAIRGQTLVESSRPMRPQLHTQSSS
jgi:hypothetical protein